MPNKQSMNHGLEVGEVGLGLRSVRQTVAFGDFVDGAGAAGTLVLAKQVPAGSLVVGSKVTVTEGFVGDTTCVMDIGTAGDADSYSYTAHNVLAVLRNSIRGADSSTGGTTGTGLAAESAAISVKLTATGASDWGLITAGKAIVEVFYFSTNEELA
jgi:hypothetical protein